MKYIEKITVYDLPDTKDVPYGYDLKSAPVASDENISFLIEKYNEMAEIVNKLVSNHRASDK